MPETRSAFSILDAAFRTDPRLSNRNRQRESIPADVNELLPGAVTLSSIFCASHNSDMFVSYNNAMTRKLLSAAAWLALATILFVTVSPIGIRPHDLLPVDIDRALAFAALSALFVLAYPHHWLHIGVALVAAAGAIELLQALSPTRHARIDDAAFKAAGAVFGVMIGWAIHHAALMVQDLRKSVADTTQATQA